jgi:tetratricopeptide (TPR) repeat protein
MPESDGSKPPAAWLSHLHEARQWTRLIELARRSLAADPDDAETHRQIAWAYAMTNRLPELRVHVDFLLKADPVDVRHHHLAAIYHLDSRHLSSAKKHIDFLLNTNPNSATFHYLACIHALRSNWRDAARHHIKRARALAPQWAAAAHLEIKMDGMYQRKASDAWARIRRLKETLALDPEEPEVLSTIGDILLDELERPREAEQFYRNALSVEPTNKLRQSKLLNAIRARSILYRTLSLPASAFRKAREALSSGRLRFIVVLVAFKVFAAFIGWLIAVGALFTPAAKTYEWFMLTEATRTRRLPPFLTPLRVALFWPLWVRMLLAASIIVGGWMLLFRSLFNSSPSMTLQIIAWIFGIHLAFVLLIVGVRKLRARFGQWQEDRRLRRDAIEAIESATG